MGFFNVGVSNALLEVGNGINDPSRHNALTLLDTGDLTISGTLFQNSDQRLKKNVQPLQNVLHKLTNIQPVSFEFSKDNTGNRTVGVLAQEVQQEFPDLVLEDPLGYLSVAYANLVAVSIQGIKELQQLNNEQQIQIDQQQMQINELHAVIQQLLTVYQTA